MLAPDGKGRLGSDIPTTPPSIDQTVRAVQADAGVVYVDVDPVVVAHSNALRSVHPGLATILADIRQPQQIQNHTDLSRHIDCAVDVLDRVVPHVVRMVS